MDATDGRYTIAPHNIYIHILQLLYLLFSSSRGGTINYTGVYLVCTYGISYVYVSFAIFLGGGGGGGGGGASWHPP